MRFKPLFGLLVGLSLFASIELFASSASKPRLQRILRGLSQFDQPVVSSSGNRIFFVHRHSIDVFDIQADSILTSIPVAEWPHIIAGSGDNKIFLENYLTYGSSMYSPSTETWIVNPAKIELVRINVSTGKQHSLDTLV